MSQHSICFTNSKNVMHSEHNSLLLDSLGRHHDFDAPCGGRGSCGKCKVHIIEGRLGEVSMEEKKFLTTKQIEHGIRLACKTPVLSDMKISIQSEYAPSRILTSHGGYSGPIDAVVKKKFLCLSPPSVYDQLSDLERIAAALNIENPEISAALLRKIPALLREADFNISAVYSAKRILSIEKGDTSGSHYGMAVDLGTTTVVVYLMDMHSGEILDTESAMNSQKSFGADVISRISHCMENKDGSNQMQSKIIRQLETMMSNIVQRQDIAKEHIYLSTIVGNTTMLHLLNAVNPEPIAQAPYIPAFTGLFCCPAHEIGFSSLPNCSIYLLPGIASYIGADIVAGIVSTDLAATEELSLLVDIGTNGEIVLGNNKQIYSCSTASGPAFEGYNISHGVGGISGAINSVKLVDGDIQFSTINDKRATGICGSASIDIIALLLHSGLMDEGGMLLKPEDITQENVEPLIRRRCSIGDQECFIVAFGQETDNGEQIVFTQKDIREIQLAKAAIAAGITTLLQESGKKIEDLQRIYIAGGFGSYIDKNNALAIGLYPQQPNTNVIIAGNTAGQGAIMCSLSRDKFKESLSVQKHVRYIELSMNALFNQEYMSRMYFSPISD